MSAEKPARPQAPVASGTALEDELQTILDDSYKVLAKATYHDVDESLLLTKLKSWAIRRECKVYAQAFETGQKEMETK